MSRSQYGRIERGELRGVPIEALVAAAAALGADIDLRVRWHGEALDRLLDAAHAALVDQVLRALDRRGWQAAVEVSFSYFGERGSIDILGWKESARALLVIEVKSVIPDAQAMISTLDRKFRLAPRIGSDRGWDARVVGRLLVVAESSTARRRVASLDALFRTAFPDRALAVREWLRSPRGVMSGLVFLSIARRDGTRTSARGGTGRSARSATSGVAK